MSIQLVVFSLGREEYALPITQVQEIIRYREPRRVSGSGSIRGVINLRSRIIPVCDLAGHLGASSAAAPEDAKIVIVDAGGVGAGLMVDGVNEDMSVEEDRIEPRSIEDAVSPSWWRLPLSPASSSGRIQRARPARAQRQRMSR